VTPGPVVPGTDVTITTTITDNAGVAGATAVVNGHSYTMTPVDGAFGGTSEQVTVTISKDDLVVGGNTVTITATDGAGLPSDPVTVTIMVTQSPPNAGSINVTSTPASAKIFINSVDKGVPTPFTFTNMPVGSYSVYVNKNGYLGSATQTKMVVSGTETKFDFTLISDPNWYKFTGFDTPVDMSPIVNTANAGKNIPVKWQLSDGNGYVSDPAKFTIKIDSVVCGAGSADPIEVYDSTITTSDLKYQGNGAWHYNWKTEKTFAGKCMNVYLKFDNGLTSPVAKFKFK
jgi:hypothetical protein